MQLDKPIDAYDPFRRPTWKWDVATAIHTGELDRDGYADSAILTAVDYLAGSLDDRDRRCIDAARELHGLDDPQRWEVEARLLAGESDEQIATKTGVAPDVVGWFEGLFFNVRDCLTKFDYLQANVIGFGSWYGFRDGDVREFWLWAAAGGGSVAVDTLVDGLRAARRPRGPARLSDYFRARSPLPLELQTFVALNMLPLNEATVAFFGGIGDRVVEASTLRRGRDRLQREVIAAARKYLAGRPISVPQVRPCKTAADRGEEAARQRARLQDMLQPAAALRDSQVPRPRATSPTA